MRYTPVAVAAAWKEGAGDAGGGFYAKTPAFAARGGAAPQTPHELEFQSNFGPRIERALACLRALSGRCPRLRVRSGSVPSTPEVLPTPRGFHQVPAKAMLQRTT